MRHIKGVIVAAAVVSVFAATTGVAQQPSHQHDSWKQAPAVAAPSTPGTGMDPKMGQQMEMCRMMMGQGGMSGGMGPGMMGMPKMMGGDPKQQADMLAMRGEMMKAMGDIMMKYAQRAQPAK